VLATLKEPLRAAEVSLDQAEMPWARPFDGLFQKVSKARSDNTRDLSHAWPLPKDHGAEQRTRAHPANQPLDERRRRSSCAGFSRPHRKLTYPRDRRSTRCRRPRETRTDHNPQGDTTLKPFGAQVIIRSQANHDVLNAKASQSPQ
jgi:hypothetical protein